MDKQDRMGVGDRLYRRPQRGQEGDSSVSLPINIQGSRMKPAP